MLPFLSGVYMFVCVCACVSSEGPVLFLKKKKDFMFCSSHSKIEQKLQRFSIFSCPHTYTAFPTVITPRQSGTFVTTDDPTLTHRYHLKSTANIRVHSWWCTFCGVWQMYSDTYPPLRYHTKDFHCRKNPLCSTYLSDFH